MARLGNEREQPNGSRPLLVRMHRRRLIGNLDLNELSNDSDCSPKKEEGMIHSLSGRFPSVQGVPECCYGDSRENRFYYDIWEAFYKKAWLEEDIILLQSLMKSKTRPSNLMRTEMFSVLSLWFGRTCNPGGRFSDGWGSCERREKRFLKPNHDIPSTAETRAKSKACQDLPGMGEYRPGAGHLQRQN